MKSFFSGLLLLIFLAGNGGLRAHGDNLERHVLVGIGIALSEVFFGPRKPTDPGWQLLGRGFFEHVQIPHTAIRNDSRY